MAQGERPRNPGITLGLLFLAILVLVATIALTQRQPPPPTIAEFAPQSVENITDSPTDQSSSSGNGPGECDAGQDCGGGGVATPTPAPPIDVPRVRRCVGDPPRQTEDPQSPPCVPYWTGDNGGATSRGVTRDQIAIAYTGQGWADTTKTITQLEKALETFLNRRFEFYGRQIVLKQVKSNCCQNDVQDEAVRADAVEADEEIGAFAATPYRTAENENVYYEELARREVITASYTTSAITLREYDDADPYMWTYFLTLDEQQRHIVDWVCRGVAGHAPRFSATYGPLGQPRRFGLVYTSYLGMRPDLDILRAGMRACGAAFAADIELQSGTDPQSWNDITIKMRDEQVSTLICLCETGYMGEFMTTASQQKYYPEWFTSTYYKGESEEHARLLWPRDQARQQFGVLFANKFLPLDSEPGAQAIREADPTVDVGQDPGYQYAKAAYEPLLLIASGIQMAGPRLTPETFRDGLRKTRFPNPGAGGPPNYQGRVSFAQGDHAMNDGGTIYWFDPVAVYTDYGNAQRDGPGSFCFAELGKRYEIGTYPDTDTIVRNGPCR